VLTVFVYRRAGRPLRLPPDFFRLCIYVGGKAIAYSFALRLSRLYLEAVGIVPQPGTSNPKHIRLARTTISPLEANGGGYVNVDTGGCQFLLDCKDARREFPSLNLTALLSGDIDPNVVRGKIVIALSKVHR
jgi:CHASE2 domain-containing sensor protein